MVAQHISDVLPKESLSEIHQEAVNEKVGGNMAALNLRKHWKTTDRQSVKFEEI